MKVILRGSTNPFLFFLVLMKKYYTPSSLHIQLKKNPLLDLLSDRMSNHSIFAYSFSTIKKVGRIVYYSVTKADTQSPSASEKLLCPTNHVFRFHHAPFTSFSLFWSLGLFTVGMRTILTNNVALVHRKPILCNFL